MHEAKLYGKEKLLTDLEEIGSKLARPVTIYLIGGCAMCLKNLKTVTKDVDVIFTSLEDLRLVEKELLALGYERTAKIEVEYDQLGAYSILRHGEKSGFDLFHIKVCNMLVLSENMIKRSTKYADIGKLTVNLISNEDITLFKGITERPRDIEDIDKLIKGKQTETDTFDWKIIKKECETQAEHLKIEGHLYNRLLELKKKYRINVPILSWLKNRDKKHLLRDAYEHRLGKGLTHEQIIEQFKKDGFTKKEILIAEKFGKEEKK